MKQFLAITGLLLLFYSFFLPHTVQMGDTGELVRAAWQLQVPHPPGYPLATWLTHFFIKLFPWGTIFWKASLLTALYSSMGLALIYLTLVPLVRSSLALMATITLATGYALWRYSVLPDVFALNFLFSALILFLYFSDRKHQFYLPFIFCLALTNHLTIVFLLPLLLHSLWVNRLDRKTQLSLTAGLMSFTGLYLSLVFLHPNDMDSWGQVDSLNGLLRHFLRSDYGTFKLVSQNEGGGLAENVLHWLQALWENHYSLLLIALPGIFSILKKKIPPAKALFLGCSLLFYILVFFSLANMPLSGFTLELFERFLILPIVMTTVLLTVLIAQTPQARSFLYLCIFLLAANSLHNIYRFHKKNDFSQNTIIEDYALNFLRSAPQTEKPLILIAMSDVRYFSTKYAQQVLNVRPELISIHPRLIFFPWYYPKLQSIGLQLDHAKFLGTMKMNLEDDIILPNLERFEFFTNLALSSDKQFKITLFSVGRQISQGQDTYVQANALTPTLRSDDRLITEPLETYSLFRELLHEYSIPQLTMAHTFLKNQEPELAKLAARRAIDYAPWNWQAKDFLCQLQPSPQCLEEAQRLKSIGFQY